MPSTMRPHNHDSRWPSGSTGQYEPASTPALNQFRRGHFASGSIRSPTTTPMAEHPTAIGTFNF